MRQERMTGPQELRNHAAEVVDQLPFDLVEMLWLVDVCELSDEAITQETGRPRPTIATDISHARAEIRLRQDIMGLPGFESHKRVGNSTLSRESSAEARGRFHDGGCR